MSENQSSVAGSKVTCHTINAHHGDDGSTSLLGCVGIQSLWFQNHHTVGGTKQQSAIGQHSSTVLAVDVALECMTELIRVYLAILADTGNAVVGTCPHVALTVGRDAQDIVGNQSVVGGVALLNAELAILVAALLQATTTTAHPDVASRVGHQT